MADPYSDAQVINLPLTHTTPFNYDITIWRGCDAMITLPIQHKFLMSIGLDYAESVWKDDIINNISKGESKVNYYQAVDWIKLYTYANMQIRKGWIRQGKTNIDPLVNLETPVTASFAPDTVGDNPIPREVQGQFCTGFHPYGYFFLFIPGHMTAIFDFDEAVYDLEFTGRDLDSLNSKIVDKILTGKIIVMGEKS